MSVGRVEGVQVYLILEGQSFGGLLLVPLGQDEVGIGLQLLIQISQFVRLAALYLPFFK